MANQETTSRKPTHDVLHVRGEGTLRSDLNPIAFEEQQQLA